MKVEKRSGKIVEFENSKIVKAVKKAFGAVEINIQDEKINELLAFINTKNDGEIKKVEDIQDSIVEWLHINGYHSVGIAFTKYRERRAIARDTSFNSVNLVNEYLCQLDDMAVHENSSTMYSLQGLNNHLFSSVSEKYWLSLYSDEIKNAYNSGRIHIHDLGIIGPYCCGWDLKAVLLEGFGGVAGKPSSKPPKHLSSALSQANNFIFTLQGESAGAQAFSNFNTLLSPFVREDNLSYNQVKQEIQQFIFNLNISTRVGFQCLSEDTEILSENGWVGYNDLKVGDKILTFNMSSKQFEYKFEYKETQNVFKEQYEGKMIHISDGLFGYVDHLVTPNHRVVVYDEKKDEYVFENAENIKQYENDINIPLPIPAISDPTYDDMRGVGFVNIQKDDIRFVDYSGIVWCPTTENGTVIARRNGKCFITGNSPFSNLTLDLDSSKVKFADEPCIIGGEMKEYSYGDCNKEATWINQAIVEVLSEGDADGAMLSYPIVTFNVTKDFPWQNKLGKTILEATSKYGPFYWANYINSDYSESDITSMCCRLKIDRREIEKHLGEYTGGLSETEYNKTHQKGHGFFGAAPLTGSCGVVTLNIPAIMYDAKEKGGDWDEFLTLVKYYMDLAIESLMKKRKVIEEYADKGLYPYLTHYLREVKKRTGHYFTQHFSTICPNGIHEALYIYGFKDGIMCDEGLEKAIQLLKFMNEYTVELQKEFKVLINLEQAPAESAGVKLCQKSGVDPLGNGYYTNSSWQPAESKIDLIDLIDMQGKLNVYYTGGSSMHTYTDSDLVPIANDLQKIIMYAFTETKIPYMTISPVFSVCHKCGRMAGKHHICPKCGSKKIEIYERIVGYYRPHTNWNKGRLKESEKRNYLKLDKKS
jgi:anaerobic ribonucleoside-triphosphate reductase